MLNAIFIFGARDLIFLVIFLAGIYFLRQPRARQKQLIIFGLSVAVISFILSRIFASLYFDPRPFVENHFVPLVPHGPDNGFPSDHTLLSAVIASVFYKFSKKAGLALWAAALFIGISRVYVGVHHPVDILASIAIAMTASLLVYPWVKKNYF